MKRALVIGSGVTGLTCSWLLARRGWEVNVLAKAAQVLPTLVLNDVTCSLLQDIWQLEDRFWQNFHHLRERQVCWGNAGAVMSVPQQSVVINSDTLVEFLRERLLQAFKEKVVFDESAARLEQLADPQVWQQMPPEFPWIIDASGRSAPIARQLGAVKHQAFGHRLALCQEVMLTQKCEEISDWIETVADGWVFLAPLGDHRALVQVMVPSLLAAPPQIFLQVLEQTRLIKPQISNLLGSTTFFSAFPQILESLWGQVGSCSSTWIAVGDAALSVDPICGDGIGYAIRGTILATSVLNGITCGGVDYGSGLHHYTLRLRQAFSAHLKACLSYYAVGFSSLAWQTEINLMQEALALSSFTQADTQMLRYGLQRLRLFELNAPAA